MQEWFDMHKLTNVIHHMNRLNDRNQVIISLDAEKMPWSKYLDLEWQTTQERRDRLGCLVQEYAGCSSRA